MNSLDDLCVVSWPEQIAIGRSLPSALVEQLGLRTGSLRRLSPAELMQIDPARSPLVVWVISDKHYDDEAMFELLDHLGNHHIPTILTRANEDLPEVSLYHTGALIASPKLPMSELAMIVRALHSQGESLRLMQRELSITRRHHGGLRGQMDKLDEELRLAARVQQEFLPEKLPSLHGVEVQVMFRPAGYVSGDVYDVQRLDEDHIGLWIADVVGHGVPAALLTMFVKAALPTKEIDHRGYRIIPPDESLKRLNDEMIARATGQSRFATACYALLNCRTGKLQVSRAGHPHPLILRADGQVEYLEPEGPLLGVFEDEPFELQCYQMHPGDRFMIYSDGFETCFAENDTHDTTRYRDEFARLGDASPQQAMRMIQQIIDAQPGSLHQVDDLTVVMAGVSPQARLSLTPPQAATAHAED